MSIAREWLNLTEMCSIMLDIKTWNVWHEAITVRYRFSCTDDVRWRGVCHRWTELDANDRILIRSPNTERAHPVPFIRSAWKAMGKRRTK